MAYHSLQSYGTQIIYDELTTHIPVAYVQEELWSPLQILKEKNGVKSANF